MQQSQFVFFLLLVFFFGVKKERKNLWGDASPNPRRPWRSGARGQLTADIKRGFVKFGTNPFSFYDLVRVSYCNRGASRHLGSEANRPVDFEVSTLGEISRLNLFYLHKHKTNVKCEMNSSAVALEHLTLFCCLCSLAIKKS